jgi:hypothetical protein
MKARILHSIEVTLCMMVWLSGNCGAQVNSGSNGSDGALNPSVNSTIDMTARASGIYQYTSVNIPSGVTVNFIPNAANTPVVWLVQGNVTIAGSINVQGQGANNSAGGLGGPGGYRGGNGVNGTTGSATAGEGPGGGSPGQDGGNASYATIGCTNSSILPFTPPSPVTYGNAFLLPLVGGSGGGGSTNSNVCSYGDGGGGGGGAILIAASGTITSSGSIQAQGGGGACCTYYCAGGGSGGAVRLVASKIIGTGQIYAQGSGCGNGRVRFDTYENDFSGNIQGAFSQGSQFVIIPAAGQGAQLTIVSVAGVSVSASPTGLIATPDAVVSAQQGNPIAIVVQCTNIPLNTPITVSVTPMNGPPVSASGFNTTGTSGSSTATVTLNLPRGGGLISATAATGN